jgi:hypothetical protein
VLSKKREAALQIRNISIPIDSFLQKGLIFGERIGSKDVYRDGRQSANFCLSANLSGRLLNLEKLSFRDCQ